MAATIRLKRMGRKKQPYYRIVVAEDSGARSAPSVEMLGIYNPRTEPAVVRVDAARALYWLHQGAMPSDTVRSLFRRTGVWEKFHAGVTPETIEEAVVHLGPPAGEDKTTQRISGTPRQPKAEAKAPATPKAPPVAKAKEPSEPDSADQTIEAEAEASAEQVVAEPPESAAEAEVVEEVAEPAPAPEEPAHPAEPEAVLEEAVAGEEEAAAGEEEAVASEEEEESKE